VVVEELLETLVGEVNAELLEGVELEDLETGNIEDTNELVLGLDTESVIDLVDNPEEETTVESLDKGITGVGSLGGVQGEGDEVTTGHNARGDDGGGKSGTINLEKGSHLVGKNLGVLNGGLLVAGELDVTEVKDGGTDAEDEVLLLLGETEDVKGSNSVLELLLVVHVLNIIAVGDTEVLVVGGGSKTIGLALVLGETRDHLVEDVERTLFLTAVDNTRLLEKVGNNRSTRDDTVSVEGDLNELTEARRVIVLGGLGVTESLEKRVSLEKLSLELALSTTGTSDSSKVLDHLLGVLSLTGTRLTSDKHGLGHALRHEVTVSLIGDSEGVRSELVTTLAVVQVDDAVGVDGEELVGVDSNTEKTRIGIDVVVVVTKLKVVENGSLREVTELGTVLDTIELDGVHAVDHILLADLLRLISDELHNSDSVIRVVDDDGVVVATIFVGNPHVLLVGNMHDLRGLGGAVLKVLLVVIQPHKAVQSRHLYVI
jgi:hypothetical protein